MSLHRIFCMFNRHSPRRNQVKWDGLNFVGSCRHCSRSIRRLERGRWVKDTHPPQGAHP